MIESQIINATGKTIITVTTTPDTNFSTYLLVFGTFALVAVTWYMTKSTRDQLKNQHYRAGLLDVFSILNPTHKDAEQQLKNMYQKDILYNMTLLQEKYEDAARMVSRDYDQVGLLVKRNLVPKEDYYEMFGTVTVIYHQILFNYVKDRRITRGKKDFRRFFTELAIECYDYWNSKNMPPYDPKTKIPINNTTIQSWKLTLQDNQ